MTELGADTDPFLLHIYAALAEKERALISRRTKDALAAAKARGVGHRRLRDKGRSFKLRPSSERRRCGPSLLSLPACRTGGGEALNERGIKTAPASPGPRCRCCGCAHAWERARETRYLLGLSQPGREPPLSFSAFFERA